MSAGAYPLSGPLVPCPLDVKCEHHHLLPQNPFLEIKTNANAEDMSEQRFNLLQKDTVQTHRQRLHLMQMQKMGPNPFSLSASPMIQCCVHLLKAYAEVWYKLSWSVPLCFINFDLDLDQMTLILLELYLDTVRMYLRIKKPPWSIGRPPPPPVDRQTENIIFPHITVCGR